MAIRLGDVAPNFRAPTTAGPIDFHQWLGDSWGVLFSHPADYTPVCTTELGAVARTQGEFERRNVKVIALSVDPLDAHRPWIRDINETQACALEFPVIADESREVARAYDMLAAENGGTATVRSVFIIGPDKRVRLTLAYPDETGRNFDEILRAIDSLQLHAAHRVATPADWRFGQDCLVPAGIPDAEAEHRFPRGVRRLKPYLRYTPQPAPAAPAVATPTAPSPAAILDTAFGFCRSKVLLTAVELGVFTRLAGRLRTGAELGAELELHPRAIADFFDALVAMKFLGRDGDGPDARYFNTPEAALFLDAASPRYIGGILVMLNARLFKYWNDLPEALWTGRPQNETKHGGQGIFAELYKDEERLEQFMGAMTGISRLNFEAFADRFDFSRYQTLCDVGGATGLLSIEAAKRHPHLQCTSFDLPAVAPIARRHVAAAGLGDRIRIAEGDFFRDPLPRADVITMGMILHDWNLEKKRQLIRAAYEALPPGGVFVAIEALIDDARRENVQGLMMSLNMLIEFGDAFDYTGADFRQWCGEAGFRRFEVIPLAGASSAAVAYK